MRRVYEVPSDEDEHFTEGRTRSPDIGEMQKRGLDSTSKPHSPSSSSPRLNKVKDPILDRTNVNGVQDLSLGDSNKVKVPSSSSSRINREKSPAVDRPNSEATHQSNSESRRGRTSRRGSQQPANGNNINPPLNPSPQQPSSSQQVPSLQVPSQQPPSSQQLPPAQQPHVAQQAPISQQPSFPQQASCYQQPRSSQDPANGSNINISPNSNPQQSPSSQEPLAPQQPLFSQQQPSGSRRSSRRRRHPRLSDCEVHYDQGPRRKTTTFHKDDVAEHLSDESYARVVPGAVGAAMGPTMASHFEERSNGKTSRPRCIRFLSAVAGVYRGWEARDLRRQNGR